MNPPIQQAVEVVFTSYLVPVFLLPALWIARAVLARRIPAIRVDAVRVLDRLSAGYVAVAVMLFLGWALVCFALPAGTARSVLLPVAWAAFAALNLLFAGLAIGMTSHFGGLPDGRQKDGLFLRFLGVVVLQPLGTAAAVALLTHLLPPGVHTVLPGLETMPGVGI